MPPKKFQNTPLKSSAAATLAVSLQTQPILSASFPSFPLQSATMHCPDSAANFPATEAYCQKGLEESWRGPRSKFAVRWLGEQRDTTLRSRETRARDEYSYRYPSQNRGSSASRTKAKKRETSKKPCTHPAFAKPSKVVVIQLVTPWAGLEDGGSAHPAQLSPPARRVGLQ
jgi:hypothetical protein